MKRVPPLVEISGTSRGDFTLSCRQLVATDGEVRDLLLVLLHFPVRTSLGQLECCLVLTIYTGYTLHTSHTYSFCSV
jgi:hypothetical protein